VERINSELLRLKAEEVAAEEAMMVKQRELMEYFARIGRLRKQQDQLRTRGVEMMRRDVSSVKELEEKEREEAEAQSRKEELERAKAQETQVLAQVQQACSSEVIDWSAVSFDDPSLSEIFGSVAQGDFGGTGEGAAGRSSNA
jgi:hypothetical protein